MGEFRKGASFGGGKRPGGFRSGGGRPSFGRKGGFGGPRRHDDERPQMFNARCAQCGDSCEVPFRPSGERPVFCKNCFGDKRDAPASKPQMADKRIDDLKRQIDSLHKKMDTIVRLLEEAAAERADA